MIQPSARCRLRRDELKLLRFQCWWGVRVGLWLCGLPILLRRYPLPLLLQRLTLVRRRRLCRPLSRDHAMRLVVWVCRRRFFRRSVFPRACLRQALALYYVLTRFGYAVEIHFGIQKEGEVLRGHSWVTVQGQPVAERARLGVFSIVYSFPSVAARSPREGAALLGGVRRS